MSFLSSLFKWDGTGKSILETGSPVLAERYQQEFDQEVEELRRDYQNLRVPLIPMSTSEAPLPVLQRYFAAR